MSQVTQVLSFNSCCRCLNIVVTLESMCPRDVERCLKILAFFEERTDIVHALLRERDEKQVLGNVDDFAISLALAVGVSYMVRLSEKRGEFDRRIGAEFRGRITLAGLLPGDIVGLCQDLFIEELELPATIARNDALKENVWMMAICMELREAI